MINWLRALFRRGRHRAYGGRAGSVELRRKDAGKRRQRPPDAREPRSPSE